MKTQKLLVVLASAALGLGLSGCGGDADASAPVHKVPTISQMDKEKQVLMAERKEKAAKDYIAKVKAEKEAQAKAKAEAESAAQAQAQAQAQGQAQAQYGGNYQPSGGYSGGKYQTGGGYSGGYSGGGGGGDLGWDPSKGTVLQDAQRAGSTTFPDGKKRCLLIGDYDSCND